MNTISAITWELVFDNKWHVANRFWPVRDSLKLQWQVPYLLCFPFKLFVQNNSKTLSAVSNSFKDLKGYSCTRSRNLHIYISICLSILKHVTADLVNSSKNEETVSLRMGTVDLFCFRNSSPSHQQLKVITQSHCNHSHIAIKFKK